MSQENDRYLNTTEEAAAEQATEQGAEGAAVAPAEEASSATDERKQTHLPLVLVAVVAALLALCTIAACLVGATRLSSRGKARVSGTITYRERMALTPDAVVIVQIQDVSRADSPADVIGEQVIHDPSQVPIPFEVAHDPRDIDKRHTYALYARIEDGQGGLLFTTTQHYPIITHGNPTENIEVVLEAVYSAPPSTVAYIKIDEPAPGAVLDISRPIEVNGRGGALPEGNVVVQVLGRDDNVLAQEATTIQAPDAGSGGEGPWSVQLVVETEPGMAGTIYAFSRSPDSGHLVAKDAVKVSLGQTKPKPKPTYIQIEEPAQGATLPLDQLTTVRGMGGGLPEGNVVVQVLDRDGNVLAQEPTTIQAPDAGSGGEGPWSVQLIVEAEPGTAGQVRAFSKSPADSSLIAEDNVEVSLGQTEPQPTYLEIDTPAEGAAVDTSQPVEVSGRGAGLPEGNVVVQARDAAGNVLAQVPTILRGRDVGSGGAGTWSIELIVGAPGSSSGQIVAFSPSPIGGSHVASAVVNVTYGQAPVLEGPTWVWDQSTPDNNITALFDNGLVAGSAGCNSYQGAYTTSSASGRNNIKIGPLASTMMMCDAPTMALENEFLAALQSATSYKLEDKALIIDYPGGSLIFYDQAGPRPRR